MKPILYALLGLLAAPFTLGQTAPRNALAGTQKQNECSVAGMVVKLWRGAKPSKAQPCRITDPRPNRNPCFTNWDSACRNG